MTIEGRLCEYCRYTFEPRRSDQRFCSNRCRRSFTAKKPKTIEKLQGKTNDEGDGTRDM